MDMGYGTAKRKDMGLTPPAGYMKYGTWDHNSANLSPKGWIWDMAPHKE
jgi:hypothetical protein